MNDIIKFCFNCITPNGDYIFPHGVSIKLIVVFTPPAALNMSAYRHIEIPHDLVSCPLHFAHSLYTFFIHFRSVSLHKPLACWDILLRG